MTEDERVNGGERTETPELKNETFLGKRADDLVKNSALYKEFLAEREEILRHKWIESEKEGRDIGFERALIDWVVKHRSRWRAERRRQS